MLDTLYNRYWTLLAIWGSALAISFILLVLLIIFRGKFLYESSDLSKTKLIRIIVYSILAVSVIFSAFKSFQLIADFHLVQNSDYQVFTGEFIGYTRFVESNEPGYPRGSFPKFKSTFSDDEIVISGTQKYEIGESYTIYYLPSSMVYVVVPTDES
jgi:hypothetical protein